MSTFDLPLITVISPCYNHAKYVIESLESIRNQTYQNIEHIIIDDCSSDDSVEKIENWIKVTGYDCIFIKHTVNKGISATLNESIRLAKGEYWTVLATDDIAHKLKFQQLFEFLSSNPSFDISVSDAGFIDEHGNSTLMNGFDSFTECYTNQRKDFKVEKYGSYESLILGNYVAGSVLIRTRALFEVGLYNENLSIEDWDMWLKLAKRNHFLYTSEKLTYYRWHDNNTLKLKGIQLYENAMTILLNEENYCKRNKIEEIKQTEYQALTRLLDDFRYKLIIKFLIKSRNKFSLTSKVIVYQIRVFLSKVFTKLKSF